MNLKMKTQVKMMSRTRGFEICSGYSEKAVLPFRGSEGSAGYDFTTVEDIEIKPFEYCLTFTGIKAYMLKNEVLNMYPRSSLYKKFGVVFTNSVGIIDSDYYNNSDNEGNIGIMLLNMSKDTVRILAGTRVAQGIFSEYLKADDDCCSDKRNGGIGSTGN